MAKKALTEHEKETAYMLCVDEGHSQKKVADFYGVSQSTISNAIKERRFLREIEKRDLAMQNAANYGVQRAIEDRYPISGALDNSIDDN